MCCSYTLFRNGWDIAFLCFKPCSTLPQWVIDGIPSPSSGHPVTTAPRPALPFLNQGIPAYSASPRRCPLPNPYHRTLVCYRIRGCVCVCLRRSADLVAHVVACGYHHHLDLNQHLPTSDTDVLDRVLIFQHHYAHSGYTDFPNLRDSGFHDLHQGLGHVPDRYTHDQHQHFVFHPI
jgi:hypothetical protein